MVRILALHAMHFHYKKGEIQNGKGSTSSWGGTAPRRALFRRARRRARRCAKPCAAKSGVKDGVAVIERGITAYRERGGNDAHRKTCSARMCGTTKRTVNGVNRREIDAFAGE